MRHVLPLLTVLLLIPASLRGQAQDPVQYEISFPNRAHHDAELLLEEDPARRGVLIPVDERSPGQSALFEAWRRAVS